MSLYHKCGVVLLTKHGTMHFPQMYQSIWRFPEMMVPQQLDDEGNPLQMDDLGVPPFQETGIWVVHALLT